MTEFPKRPEMQRTPEHQEDLELMTDYQEWRRLSDALDDKWYFNSPKQENWEEGKPDFMESEQTALNIFETGLKEGRLKALKEIEARISIERDRRYKEELEERSGDSDITQVTFRRTVDENQEEEETEV
ncbi:hypothetical protein HYV70_00105 [Candidatus Uhrbacteria bacterium]|nr:hypothetical protein [Candidatus Uhrbacteria bacterium]